MPVVPDLSTLLATPADVEARLGRLLTEAEEERLTALLTDASAAVRAYTGQYFTLVEDDVVRLKVKGGMVRLPQRPVVAVAVASTTGTTLLHTWDAGPQVWLSSSLPVINATFNGRSPQYVDVTYTHGYEAIPDDIVAVVCQMAARAMGTPADQTGIQSETVVSYSYQLGAAAAAGGIGMLPAERQVLDRYKMPAGPIVSERR